MRVLRTWYELVIDLDQKKICHGDSLDEIVQTFYMFQELDPKPKNLYSLSQISECEDQEGNLKLRKKLLNLTHVLEDSEIIPD